MDLLKSQLKQQSERMQGTGLGKLFESSLSRIASLEENIDKSISENSVIEYYREKSVEREKELENLKGLMSAVVFDWIEAGMESKHVEDKVWANDMLEKLKEAAK